MIKLISNAGFTLTETLVAINLIFITISLAFSFYLFVNRFSLYLNSKYTDSYVVRNCLRKIDWSIKKADTYQVKVSNSTFMICTSSNDSIFIMDKSICLNGIKFLDNCEVIELLIYLKNGKTFQAYELKDNVEYTFRSPVIHSININITYKKKLFTQRIYSPIKSIANFNNIET